ncbi:MAG: hypothetical protein [Caudoviricetes sp.]|nr:MAG: hypothetical protein [Caudoviricetes sp.]
MGISTVPLKAVPSQPVNVNLAGQPCTIILREIGGRQYLSLSINGKVICRNVLVVNRSAIVRAAYTGFIGELAAIDTQGDEAPQYSGWGTRWLLAFNDAI